MSKVTINIDQYDAAGLPLNGYVTVQLSNPVVDLIGNKTYLPAVARVEVVSGVGVLNLEQSGTQTYTFSVYQYGIGPESSLVWAFQANVPTSLVPIKWTDLVTQTGIAQDNQDSSLQAVLRKLLYDDSFWTKLQQTFYLRKGDYSVSATYLFGNVVYYQGNLYSSVSQVPILGKDPISFPTLWQIFSEKGATGSGTTGDSSDYDATAWNNVTAAPSKAAVRNIIETLSTKAELATKVSAANAVLTAPVLLANPTSGDNSLLIPSTNWVRSYVTPYARAVNPIGMIGLWLTASAPALWVFYDGRTVDLTTYAELYNVLGTQFNSGGEPGGTFRLPDFRGRVPIGLDTMSAVTGAAGVVTGLTAIGSKGGAQTHVLTTPQLPSHAHLYAYSNLTVASGSTQNVFQVSPNTGFTLATTSTGSGTAHNNLQPYLGLSVIGFANV